MSEAISTIIHLSLVISHSNDSVEIKMKGDELKRRTKEFAHRCVKLAMTLPETALGRHIRGQVIRCSTSVAANYRATCLSQSNARFIAKISIVLEEADESAFWLEFVIDENLLKINIVKPLLQEAEELTRIFAASRKASIRSNSNSTTSSRRLLASLSEGAMFKRL